MNPSTTDEQFAEIGHQLADAVGAAFAPWLLDALAPVLAAWRSSGSAGAAPALIGDDDVLHAELRAVAAESATTLRGELLALASTDVDAQRVTPLQLVRAAVTVVTAVLAGAGVPPVVRDEFAEKRLPDDHYGLTPPSLAALGPEVGALGIAWGAAKAAAHRARHAV